MNICTRMHCLKGQLTVSHNQLKLVLSTWIKGELSTLASLVEAHKVVLLSRWQISVLLKNGIVT